jgi:hypothetical protein
VVRGEGTDPCAAKAVQKPCSGGSTAATAVPASSSARSLRPAAAKIRPLCMMSVGCRRGLNACLPPLLCVRAAVQRGPPEHEEGPAAGLHHLLAPRVGARAHRRRLYVVEHPGQRFVVCEHL